MHGGDGETVRGRPAVRRSARRNPDGPGRAVQGVHGLLASVADTPARHATPQAPRHSTVPSVEGETARWRPTECPTGVVPTPVSTRPVAAVDRFLSSGIDAYANRALHRRRLDERLGPYLKLGCVRSRRYPARLDMRLRVTARPRASAWRDSTPMSSTLGRILRGRRGPGDVVDRLGRRSLRRPSLRRVVSGAHRLSAGRCGNAPAVAEGSCTTACGWSCQLPAEGSPHRLDQRRRFFLDHLYDGDLRSNNDGWQWSPGQVRDAAPYFRCSIRSASRSGSIRTCLHPPLGVRTGHDRREVRPWPAVDGTPTGSRGLPGPDGGSRHRTKSAPSARRGRLNAPAAAVGRAWSLCGPEWTALVVLLANLNEPSEASLRGAERQSARRGTCLNGDERRRERGDRRERSGRRGTRTPDSCLVRAVL